MKLKSNLTLLLLSPSISLAREDLNYDPDPARNSRPQNITDLAYWLHGWTGSYYNGTTTFHFTPLASEDPLEDDQDEDEEGQVCRTFANKTSSFSFDSLALIAPPDASAKKAWSNPVQFNLKSWLPGTNLFPSSPAISGLYTDPFPGDQTNSLSWYLDSVAPPGLNDERSTHPRWNIALDKPRRPDGINTLFSFSATPIYYKESNYRSLDIKGLQVNMSTCDKPFEETWWGTSFLTMNDTYEGKDRFIPVDPIFRVAFDNQSASFQYSGYYLMNTDPGNDFLDNGDPKRNTLVGTVRVEFLGSIDPVRSDILVESDDGKPAWVPVVGFGNGTGTIDAGAGSGDSGGGGLKSNSPGVMQLLVTGALVLIALW